MSKPRSNVADYAVYLLVRVIVCTLQTLSYRAGQAVMLGLAALAYRVNARHRQVALENLRLAFPEQGEAERDRQVRAVYRHFCTLLLDLVHMPRRLHYTNWREYLELPHGRGLVDQLLRGRPLMFVTGHLGNWEMGSYVIALLGFKMHPIARPLDNPFLDDFLRRFRERTGQRLLAKHGDFEQMQAILEAGGVIGTVADQDAGARGLFVNFFGRPASTHKAVALLSLEYRVPLVVLATVKVADRMRHRALLADVIDPDEYRDHADAVRAITERFTAALERLVRQAPEQYFWLHRRWKHQPAKKRGQRAA
jgi:KDO2-lipid IV(A) lauroyltransferase